MADGSAVFEKVSKYHSLDSVRPLYQVVRDNRYAAGFENWRGNEIDTEWWIARLNTIQSLLEAQWKREDARGKDAQGFNSDAWFEIGGDIDELGDAIGLLTRRLDRLREYPR